MNIFCSRGTPPREVPRACGPSTREPRVESPTVWQLDALSQPTQSLSSRQNMCSRERQLTYLFFAEKYVVAGKATDNSWVLRDRRRRRGSCWDSASPSLTYLFSREQRLTTLFFAATYVFVGTVTVVSVFRGKICFRGNGNSFSASSSRLFSFALLTFDSLGPPQGEARRKDSDKF